MASIVSYSNGKEREVKNLGWLLKHSADVTHIQLEELAEGRAFMYVTLRFYQSKVCPMSYKTEWASYELACRWLNRPVFKGVDIAKFPGPNQNTLGDDLAQRAAVEAHSPSGDFQGSHNGS